MESRLRCYGLAELSFGDHRRLGILSDVTEHGAWIFMDHGPMAGARVELALLTYGGEAFRCRARVVRVTQEGVGLSFEERAEALPGLVAANEPV